MKIRFLIYGLGGWCLEIFWTGLGSLLSGDMTLPGRTSIWMFLIYGLAVFIEPIHEKLRGRSVFIRGGVYALTIYFIEFTTGLTLKLLLGTCPWSYSGIPLSIYGIITLSYLPVWFLTGLLFERTHDLLLQLKKIRPAAQS
ncbi:MAG TPA: hypothetical protein VIK72_09945 [Clostridiaceae bacterium]